MSSDLRAQRAAAAQSGGGHAERAVDRDQAQRCTHACAPRDRLGDAPPCTRPSRRIAACAPDVCVCMLCAPQTALCAAQKHAIAIVHDSNSIAPLRAQQPSHAPAAAASNPANRSRRVAQSVRKHTAAAPNREMQFSEVHATLRKYLELSSSCARSMDLRCGCSALDAQICIHRRSSIAPAHSARIISHSAVCPPLRLYPCAALAR